MFPWLSALEFEFVEVSYTITPCGFGPETMFTEFVRSGTDCMFECKYIYNMSCVLVHQQSNRSMFSLSLLFLALPLSSFSPLLHCDGQNVSVAYRRPRS